LLTTPLSVRDILRGQLLSLGRQFLGPLLVVLAIELFLVIAASQRSFQTSADVFSFGVRGLIMLLTDLGAVIGVAIASALTARSPNHANVTTVFRVLILPSLVFLAVSLVTVISGAPRGPNSEWKFYIPLWFWLGIGADIIFGLPAWWQVLTRFPQLAVRRYGFAPAPIAG